MDFYTISEKTEHRLVKCYPCFNIIKSKDMMVQGGKFYAVWDEEAGLWTRDEYRLRQIVDADIKAYAESHPGIIPSYMSADDSGIWNKYKRYVSQLPDNYSQLDSKVIFRNTKPRKEDYASIRLDYDLEDIDTPAYNEITSTLYDPEELEKIEWAIGAIISGDSKKIQKFEVLYGKAGTGKGTILDFMYDYLFKGYCSIFDAKELATGNNAFAGDSLAKNPLVAIQPDGDLSNIKDNSILNTIISHEDMVINEKFKSKFTIKINSFLFIGTNKPVKITDAKSGLIRRLIDVVPTGIKVPPHRYEVLMERMKFECGGIAHHCLEVYKKLGKNYYAGYVPIRMMYQTDEFFNFVEHNYFVFKEREGIALQEAYNLYKEYVSLSGDDKYKLPMYKFREELKNYFLDFKDRARLEDGTQVRSYFVNFDTSQFDKSTYTDKGDKTLLKLSFTESVFDLYCKDCKAQYANEDEIPAKKWDSVKTTLYELDTTKVHYVMPPSNMIVIDFDLKDEHGNKSREKNLEAAAKWPKTYAEFSKSGAGVHLHYIYKGDVTQLSRLYDENIEIKVFTGNSSLRRRLTFCNNEPIAEISSNLPLKERSNKMMDFKGYKSRKKLEEAIVEAIHKGKPHYATKPNIDFIKLITDQAYENGMEYDFTSLRPAVIAFAANSSHQAETCLKTAATIHWKSENAISPAKSVEEAPIIFYDVEVFPNLFLVNWKFEEGPIAEKLAKETSKLNKMKESGEDTTEQEKKVNDLADKFAKSKKVNRMINPQPEEIESLMKYRWVGFNCRRYDNHIMYGRFMGYTNEQLYLLSQRIIGKSNNAFFGEAYNLSYTDIYDYAAKKQSLKKWEIELGIHHQELGLPWDQPVPEELWPKVAEYCDNDVLATEAVWNATKGDFVAREILAELAGGTVNDTTNSLTTKIIFGKERHPKLVYTNLKTGEQM